MWKIAVSKRVLPRMSCRARNCELLGSVHHRPFASDSKDKDKDSQKRRDPSNRKENFDRKFLQPAAKGSLGRKHQLKIPKLASRKNKATLQPIGARNKGVRIEDDRDDNEWMNELGNRRPRAEMAAKDDIFGQQEDANYDDYYDLSLINDDKYFWREEEVETVVEPLDEQMIPSEGNELVLEYLESDRNPIKGEFDDNKVGLDDGGDLYGSDDEEEEQARPNRMHNEYEHPLAADPEQNFFMNQFDLTTAAALPEDMFLDEPLPEPKDKVLPLSVQGPELEDFLEAMTHHPADYGTIETKFEHPDSLREAKPLFAKDRAQPPLDFVEKYKRFLYVTGFPTLSLHGEQGDLENIVHFKLLQKQVTECTGVDSSQVHPVSLNSAFVGFHSPREMALVIQKGPLANSPISLPILRPFQSDDAGSSDFAKDAEDRVLKITNLPAGHSSESLATALFPSTTEVGQIYGDVKTEDIHFLSNTSALIRFASAEQAESAAGSSLLQEQLHQIGSYQIRFLRARRELVHRCFGGPANDTEMRQQGPRLIVDNEMPPKKFYISHARVIQLSNVDTNITKEELSAFFQPYCEARRDANGSIEFVTCESGLPTGQAYVGFDIPGEAEACTAALTGRFRLGQRFAVAKLVHDRRVPNRPYAGPEKRPLRTEAELLKDLNEWERFVDPQDIEAILASGITKDILDEVMRGFRYQNPTFGPLDAGLRSEALQPERASGEMYQEVVRTYIKTLKECLPTEENPGEIYELLHQPDEPLDLSIFEDEKERLALLKERRMNPIL